MARSVRQRATHKEAVYAEEDSSGGDTEMEETPKGLKQNLSKRRFSELPLDKDKSEVSFVPDFGRVPLKSVNLNDDEAEKRKRRKSAKAMRSLHSDNAEAGPSSEVVLTDGLLPALGKQKQAQLASIAPTPIINVPFDVMSSNFEEWMKMATDNKINATNSWNFALIDYFHDMSLLRNDSDNSINFQRASCTLDGCVKIWTSRVDSVGTETGKLLSNLADEANNADDDQASDNPDAGETQQTKRTRTHRQESTLAKNAAQLRSKKLDLEFSIDPLFKKTCADFDEGGAHGLLMNHLSLGVGSEGALRVVFDASDSMAKDGEDGEDGLVLEPEEEVDLSELRAQFLPNLEDLDAKVITPSLTGFSFSKDSFSFEPSLYHNDDTQADLNDSDIEGDGFIPMDVDDVEGDPGQVEDFFIGDQAVHDDFGGGDFGHDEFGGATETAGAESSHQNDGTRSGPFVPFDPGRAQNERDLVMAMTDADASGGMMDYFDQNFLKNWAGPEHWKLRKVVRRPENSEVTAKPKREKKEAYKIDFFTPSERSIKEFSKEKFAPVTRGAGIILPGYGPAATTSKASSKKRRKKEKEKKVEQVLPDDMHFSSRQLVTLYLKPKFSLKMRGQRVPLRDGDAEIDENFWAQAAANQAAGRVDSDESTVSLVRCVTVLTPFLAADGGIPFNTQFFHDDYDDGPGFDDIDEGGGGGISVDPEEQDLLATVAGISRRVRPQFVDYAKKAKRVDVRKLKENIWKGLKIVVPEKKAESEDESEETEGRSKEDLTDPSNARVFESVITNLRKSYPKEKMEEISTSFCFICLLHLANEKGLKIEVGEDSADAPDVEEGDNRVGDIWGLKVSRDPNATPGS